jgi:hypothetical protein
MPKKSFARLVLNFLILALEFIVKNAVHGEFFAGGFFITLNKNFGFAIPKHSVIQKYPKFSKNLQTQSVIPVLRFQSVNFCCLRFEINLSKFVNILVTWS